VKNDLVKVQRFIGRRIAELRIAREITQEQLAEKSEVDARYLQRIEAGEINLTVDTLVRIANVLRVEIGALFGADVPPSRARVAPSSLRNAGPRRRKK
jgi:transcriptional regulator with XRE-family HTH domain